MKRTVCSYRNSRADYHEFLCGGLSKRSAINSTTLMIVA